MKPYPDSDSERRATEVNNSAAPFVVLDDKPSLDAAEKEGLGPFGILYSDRFVTVARDLIHRSGGLSFGHIRVFVTPAKDGVGGVVVVPRCRGRVLFCSIFRVPTRSRHLELPRGMIEPEQSLEQTAIRELQEEAGVTANMVKPLGVVYPDTGLLGHSVHVFGAELPESSHVLRPKLEEGILHVVQIEITSLPAYLRSGLINDGISLSALMLARSQGFLPT
jgi:ADP-ribose diphosphatase